MYEDRLNEHIDAIDAEWFPEAAGWDGFPPSFDEWNARRITAGDTAGSFDEYLADIDKEEHSENH